jgi:cell division protein FtsB
VNRWSERLVVPLAVVTAVGLLIAWLPVSTLLTQSSQISAANRQLAALRAESQQLTAERAAMSSASAAVQLAREEYQLVQPGQRLIQVLTAARTGVADDGDPGNQPLAPVTTAGVGTLGNPSDPAAATLERASTLWSRVLGTLEFWR